MRAWNVQADDVRPIEHGVGPERPSPSASTAAVEPIGFAWLIGGGVLATDELSVFQRFGSKMHRHVGVNHNRSEFARWD